jgi:hypothetical protein
VGLEKSEQLGGSASFGHQRIYETASVEFFRQQFPEMEWDFIDDNPLERRKGEWKSPDEDGVLSEERFFLRGGFYSPRMSYQELIERLRADAAEFFQLRTHALEIREAEKTLVCSNGKEIGYEKIVWCSPLEGLAKVWAGDKVPLLKAMKDLDEAPGGFNLEMELSAPLFPCRNTVVFPFRYKDQKLRALGMNKLSSSGQAGHTVHWIVMMEKGLADDREEVAKCIRTLKRELGKEFEELKDLTVSERIIYLSKATDEAPVGVKSLALLPDVIYVGPQVRLPNTKEEARDLDRTLDNCLFFLEMVGPGPEEKPSLTAPSNDVVDFI